ncbi:hypothetical protein POJ06DRAFT_236039 [Lipomyces tetrasporus]|uniref:Uncharacterized protein n=1 Tax=Lipomyces tetrasporus TaxID=54092 RepID=A0AAD7QX41_9ASCO|nr:uncharacterized protein POJ06DRAFT_236039 [Lipomyces tetrasporus]KAJ8103100.1 hypothetical protein POJ06DRAFT_236039 [Lipomyces tetrasporus]
MPSARVTLPEPLSRHCPTRALLVTADHKIKIDEAPIMSPGEVLLRVRTTGVYGYVQVGPARVEEPYLTLTIGLIFRFWKAGRIGELKVLGDCILGHEAAGEVVAVDENVTNATVGG